MFDGNMAEKMEKSIVKGDLELMKGLIKSGADVNATDKKNRTLLWLSMRNNHIEQFETLLANGAKTTIPTESGETIVHTAAGLNTTNYLKKLIEYGAPVDILDKGDATPLFYAVGNPAKNFELLIDHDADVNHQDVVGDTPLYFAAAADDYNRVISLLNLGANPLQRNKRNETFQGPLASGPEEGSYKEDARKKREEIRQWLKEKNIEINF